MSNPLPSILNGLRRLRRDESSSAPRDDQTGALQRSISEHTAADPGAFFGDANNPAELPQEPPTPIKKGLCQHYARIDFRRTGYRDSRPHPDFTSKQSFLLVDAVIANKDHCIFCEFVGPRLEQWWERHHLKPYAQPSDIGVAIEYESMVSSHHSKATDRHNQYQVGVLQYITLKYFRVGTKIRYAEPVLRFQKCFPPGVPHWTQKNLQLTEWPNVAPYTGRVRPEIALIYTFLKWKESCSRTHGEACSLHGVIDRPSRLRLIDVEQMCVVEFPELPSSVNWVTLSYLWGGRQAVILATGTHKEFRRMGSLLNEDLPQTIRDAITVTKGLKEMYLWVDSLCIVQDSPPDKLVYLPMMDAIYSHSALTIVDASSDDANGGLAGVQFPRRPVSSVYALEHSIYLAESHFPLNPEASGYLSGSSWSTRGWTLQEGLLSPRLLIFTPEQVFWQCAEATWCEEGHWEDPKGVPKLKFNPMHSGLSAMWKQNDIGTILAGYSQLVEEYTNRALTQPEDVLNAISGVLRVITRPGLEFHWALPTSYMAYALLWDSKKTKGGLQPRSSLCPLPNGKYCPFPSWSWVGWIGHATLHMQLSSIDHACLEFYDLDVKGNPQLLQSGSLNQKATVVPSWKGSTTAITHVPEAIFSQNLERIVLCFYSSTAMLQIHWPDDAKSPSGNGQPMLLTNSSEDIDVCWDRVPERRRDSKPQFAKVIIIRGDYGDAGYTSFLWGIVAETMWDGITYRIGSAAVREVTWEGLENRKWERVFMA